MSNLIDDYIKKINTTYISDKLNKIFKKIVIKAKQLTKKGRIQVEIEKCKLELRKKYKELGVFINNVYIDEKVKDFSYKEKYFELNREIHRLRNYLDSLKKDKYSIK